MANYCSNTVSFDGDDKQIERLIRAFNMSKEKTPNGHGCKFILLPPNYKVQNWFIDLTIEDDERSMYYQTKWSPDPVQLLQACRMFSVSFVLSYEEGGLGLYGEFRYDHVTDELHDRCLSNDEIAACMHCADEKNCHTGGCKGGTDCESPTEDYDKLDNELSNSEWQLCQVNVMEGTYHS
jgi:hypothetical protein